MICSTCGSEMEYSDVEQQWVCFNICCTAQQRLCVRCGTALINGKCPIFKCNQTNPGDVVMNDVPCYERESLTPEQKIEKAVECILKTMEKHYGLVLDEHFTETPARVARAYKEIFGGLIDSETKLKAILSKTFSSSADEMVLVKNIKIYSMCPHHLLPVECTVSVGYLPNGKVLGLSKLSRVVELMGQRPIIQEDLTTEIAKTIQDTLQCKGVGVKIEGYHFCMKMRGVKKEAPAITTCMLGVFRDRPATRQEFLDALR